MSDDKNIKEEIIDVVNGNCAEDNAAHQKHTESAEEGDDSDAEVDLRSRFRCNFCSFTTIYPGNIIQHQRFVHGGERPYECPHCDWKFAKSYSLRLHIASKHNDVASNSNNNSGGSSSERKPKRKSDELGLEDGNDNERSNERIADEPKPPPNGFMLWLRENHNKVKQTITGPGNSSKETLIEAGKRWKAMSSDHRCEYKMRAMEIRQDYYAKYPKTSSGPARKSVLFVSGSSNQRQKQHLNFLKTESILKVPNLTRNAAAPAVGRASQSHVAVVQQLPSQVASFPPEQRQQQQQWPVISAATTSTLNGNQLQFTLPPHLLGDPQQQYVIVIPMMQAFPTTTTAAAATTKPIQQQQSPSIGKQHPSEFPSDVKPQINASSQQIRPKLEQIFRCSNCQREFASNSEAVAHLNGANCTATNSKPTGNSKQGSADALIPTGSNGKKSVVNDCKEVKIEVIEID